MFGGQKNLQANNNGFAAGSCGGNAVPNTASVKVALDYSADTEGANCSNNTTGMQMCAFRPTQ